MDTASTGKMRQWLTSLSLKEKLQLKQSMAQKPKQELLHLVLFTQESHLHTREKKQQKETIRGVDAVFQFKSSFLKTYSS